MKQSEKGFTAIEFIVGISIVALIALGAGAGTLQIIKSSQRSNDHTIAVRESQRVGYWVSEDALMSQKIEIGDDPGTGDVEFISVYWKDWQIGNTYEIRYIWLDSVDSLKKLKRKQLVRDKDGVEIEQKATLIADNIHTANLSEQSGGWRLSVEARSGGNTETREYEISQRREAQEV